MSVLSYFLITSVGKLLYFANPSPFHGKQCNPHNYWSYKNISDSFMKMNNNIYIKNDNGRLAKYIYNIHEIKIKMLTIN